MSGWQLSVDVCKQPETTFPLHDLSFTTENTVVSLAQNKRNCIIKGCWMTSCLSLPTSLQRPTPVNTPQHQESMSIPHPWDSTGSGPDRLLSSRLELCNSLEVCLHGPSNHCSVLWTLQPNWFSFYPPHPALAARTSDAVKGSVLLYIQDTSASPLTLH